MSENYTLFEPPNLSRGLVAEDIKQIPKVKAFLLEIIEEERNKAFEKGYAEGLEQGKLKSYEDAKAGFESDFSHELSSVREQVVEALKSLSKPLPSLEDSVRSALVGYFKEALAPVVLDPSIYDSKLKTEIDSLLDEIPENNRDVLVKVSPSLHSVFIEYFTEVSNNNGVRVEVVEMNDLIRVVSVAGSYRFSHKEHLENVVSGDLI